MGEPLHLCSECRSNARTLIQYNFDYGTHLFRTKCETCGKQTSQYETQEMAEHIWNVINKEEGNKR